MNITNGQVSKLIEEVVKHWREGINTNDGLYGYMLVDRQKTYQEISEEVFQVTYRTTEMNNRCFDSGLTPFNQNLRFAAGFLWGNISNDFREIAVNIMNTNKRKGDIYFFRYEYEVDVGVPEVRVVQLRQSTIDYLMSGNISSGLASSW